MVTARLIISGVRWQTWVAFSHRPLSAVTAEALPSERATLSQYITLVPVYSASRISFSWVSAAEAPISSVAPRITSS